MTKFEALQILGLIGVVSNADIKLAYRRKAQAFHPDRNPAGAEIMKMINVAYDIVKDETDVEVFESDVMADYPEVLAAAINAILSLNLTLEICGLWVWVSGETKTHKEVLKASGYMWAPKKKMWYYRPAQAKARKYSSNKNEWSMNDIREKFGASRPASRSNYLENRG